MSERAWPQTLPQTLDAAWEMLALGTRTASAAARHPVLATLDADGWPAQRILVLRGADKLAGTVELHTDRATAKITEIEASPKVSLHVWDAERQVQIRLKGRATISAGASVLWDRLPEAAKRNYGVEPIPGTPIADPSAATRTPSLKRFSVISVELDAIETLCLALPDHNRAVFRRADDWNGYWISP